MVAEWLNAAVLKGELSLSHSVRLSPFLPRYVCRSLTLLSLSIRSEPAGAALSPHNIPQSLFRETRLGPPKGR